MASTSIHLSSTARTKLSTSTLVQIVSAVILGLAMIYGVGFAHMDVVHNAAHDVRHAFAFPCH